MKRLILAAMLITGCGTETTSDLDIVGGQRVYRSWYGRVGGCGSTLIHKRWAISAAHCFGKTPKEVRFGLYKRSDPNNGGKPMDVVPVKRVIKHPSWDLALIELKRDSKMKPKSFANITPQDDSKLQVFGFGNASYGSGAPEYLQGTVLRFNAKASNNARPQILRAGAPNKATCHGDSGGPLMYQGRLIATATFTVGKCQPGGLMGFTRVDVDWVRKYL
jgi:secreted trypsin-like serine protease